MVTMGRRKSGNRSRNLIWHGLLLFVPVFAVMFLLAGCSSSMVTTLQVTPASQSVAVGQTAQFKALGIFTHGDHPATTQDETTAVTWSSSAPAIATINAAGLATAVSAGTTTITASMNGFNGTVSASATMSVTGAGGGGGGSNLDIVAISIIPSSQSVASPGGTAQFIPIGTTAGGATVNLTGAVVWASSSQQIATIGANSGIATAVSQGTSTITAVYTNTDKTVATGTATFQVVSGTAEQVTALTIFPAAQSATAAAQQSQFTVLGTENGLQYDITDDANVVWTSSNLAVATIGAHGIGTPGLATAVGAGSTTIAATYTNKDQSKVVATATYNVSIGAAQEPLLSINIVPAGVTVSNKGMTGQYLAFGNYSTTPTVRDLTNQVTWLSLLPEVASINSGGVGGASAGLATAQGYTGFSPIYAEMTNPDGTVVLSNSQTFTCRDPVANACIQDIAHPQFATVTIFIEGQQTFVPNLSQIGPDSEPYGEYVTGPSDTGTKDLIHCGPQWTTVGGSGGQVCTGVYETGTTVVLSENLLAGSTYFGGWSSGDGLPGVGCQEPNLATSTTCTLTLTGNATVGVIFY